jgi:hypothetical protein
MNLFRLILTAGLMTVSLSVHAVVSQTKGYASAENVISQDEAVRRAQLTLIEEQFVQLSTVTNPTYYIVPPKENSYQTAEAIITMVGKPKSAEQKIEYADVRIAIIYDSETNTYSAGEISVKFTSSNSRSYL